ncbi:nitrite reductase (cytochrome, ammonia-forming) [Propionibacterium acidifaciens F0233]|uniref:nitrite reductase (cytochrome; ammonia-forming) n=1 Tax=Propionibacterium acidifaciens F0233 TaxID=553198 RepID=U2RUB7_9ACTN|nr:ammonia-forming cytochrome c nitrite reductase subunit c552 [Propionibacterium acidifaciens]ERK54262.1 nitrite reductase (cytochrome, ammonia-forming) [Propionibacterium acidifaciens F0233]
MSGSNQSRHVPRISRMNRTAMFIVFLVAGALIIIGIAALLMSIFNHKEEGKEQFTEVVALDETTIDPAVWGQNFPEEYESYMKTSDPDPGNYFPRTPTADDPREWTSYDNLAHDQRLVTMWAGYAFSLDYTEPRGHNWMLVDQRHTKRTTQVKQPGYCLNCHVSVPKLFTDLGNGDAEAGWSKMNSMTYDEAYPIAEHYGALSCIDCHDPATMKLRVTRPAFIKGIAAYKASQGVKDYDVNSDASTQEMRTYVCAQCHVEYYQSPTDKNLTFPWNNGLTIDDEYNYYQQINFTDFTHKLTGASIIKAQHPDFETWSNGPHAQAGVTCADCHMAYQSAGAKKVSNHHVTSPMADVNGTCGTCHKASDDEMKARVATIQTRFYQARDVSFDALVDLIDDIEAAQTNGTPQDRIDAARNYQRKANFYMDYVESENSHGFHAPEYSLRILNDVTDTARQGQLALAGADVPSTPEPGRPHDEAAPQPAGSAPINTATAAAPTPSDSPS